MAKKFEMSIIGELTLCLGFQVKQLTNGIFFCQVKYIAYILKRFGFSYSKPVKTPMSPSSSLSVDPTGADVYATLYRGMI